MIKTSFFPILVAAVLILMRGQAAADSLLVTTNVTVGLNTYSAIVRYAPSGALIAKYQNGGFLSELGGITVDSRGNIYVANDGYGTIDEFSPTGAFRSEIETYSAGIQGIALDPQGDIFACDDEFDALEEYLPSGGYQNLEVGGSDYGGLAMDPSGNLYEFSYGTIFKMKPFGNSYFEATLAVAPCVAVDDAGNVYCIEYGNDLGTVDAVIKTTRSGVATTVGALPRASAASAEYEYGMAVDGSGNIYISNGALGVIYKMTPKGACSVFARIDGPTFLAWDPTGDTATLPTGHSR